ncbi:MAG TPA: amidase family protein [Aquamicrobium sp.]|nr:amidase family protein [Aquamicrobium sp.]
MTETAIPLAVIAGRLRDGRMSCAALAEDAIAAHEARGPQLRAYKSWEADRARTQARAADALLATGIDLGPLMGIPVSVKDLYGVPGFPTFAGTDEALPADWTRAGPVVSRLLAQLGIVTGKTHTVEFAFGGIGVNAHWGAPANPWSGRDGPRAPGGSSSGAGVSLVEGSALVALGTDTAGSVRIPAAFAGQAGLKTTYGRWSNDGIVPLSSSLDTPGLLCRTVADLAFAFAALDPEGGNETPARPLSGLRIAVPEKFFWDDADVSVSARVTDTLALLERRGATLVPVEIPGCEEVLAIFRKGGLAAAELRAFLERHFPERIARLDPVVRLRVQEVEAMSGLEYLRRREELALWSRRADSVFAACDVVASPTVAISPPRLEDVADIAAYARANMLVLRNTAIANLLGWCALTLPVGPDALGLPVGLQLMAPPLAEEALLAAGRAIEQTIGTGADLMGTCPFSS